MDITMTSREATYVASPGSVLAVRIKRTPDENWLYTLKLERDRLAATEFTLDELDQIADILKGQVQRITAELATNLAP